MAIAGWVLIGLGILFLAVSLVAAAREEFAKKTLEGTAESAQGILSALASVLAELAKLPKWLAMAVVGVALIVAGAMLVPGGMNNLVGDPATLAPAAAAPQSTDHK